MQEAPAVGKGRFFFIGDVGSNVDLKNAENAVDQIRRAVTGSPAPAEVAGGSADVESLRREVFSLRLGLEVLGQILIEKKVVTEAELARLAGVLFGGQTGGASPSPTAPADPPNDGGKHKHKKGKPGKPDLEQILAIEALPKVKD